MSQPAGAGWESGAVGNESLGIGAVTRRKWFKPMLLAGTIGVILAVQVLPSAGPDEVVQRLEEKYGAERIVWTGNGRYERDTLVVDGRDVSEECVVEGEWGPLDDLAIDCETDVGIRPVEP